MRKILIATLLFTGSVGFTQISYAVEGGVKIFVDGDWFLPGNVADGEAAYLTGTSYVITTPAALGFRGGVVFPLVNDQYLGISAGYIAGPVSKVKLTNGANYLDYTRELSFMRTLVEAKKEYSMGDKWAFRLGSGVGMAFGSSKRKITRASNGSAGTTDDPQKWSGLIWEGSIGFTQKMRNSELTYSLRYAGLPTYKGDVAEGFPKIDWSTIVISIGLGFGGSGESTPRKEIAPKYRETPYREQRSETLKQEPADDLPVPGNVETTESYETYLEHAKNHISQNDYAKAIKEYDKALSVLPENDEREVYILERKGVAYVKLENHSKANESYISAIKSAKALGVTNKTAVNAYLGLAYSLQETGNAKEARANYKMAWKLTKDPKTKRGIEKALNRLKANAE